MRVHEIDRAGPVLADADAAVDVIGEAWSHDAELVVLPVERLPPEFFRLATGLAGDILQKFVNYGVRVAVVGDIDDHLSGSSALRDFVRESNAGPHVWFVADRAGVDRRVRRLTG